MTQLIIIFAAVLIIYLLLRSEGGSGLSIKFKVPAYSTMEGRRVRVKLILVVLISIGSIIFAALSSTESKVAVQGMIISYVAGALVIYLLRKKQK